MMTVEEAIEELNKYEEGFNDSTFGHMFFSFLLRDGGRNLHICKPTKDDAIGYMFDKVELYGYEIEDMRAVTSERLSGRQLGKGTWDVFPTADLDVQITLKRGGAE